jgi:hypothetical protein
MDREWPILSARKLAEKQRQALRTKKETRFSKEQKASKMRKP